MSSLAASQADGYYHPPDYDPSKHGSINRFQNSKGASAFARHGTVRFALAYDGWCLGCGKHVGAGTRFNATKAKVGEFLGTPVWEFSMKCPACPNRFAVRTDPKHAGYEYRSGIRKNRKALAEHELSTPLRSERPAPARRPKRARRDAMQRVVSDAAVARGNRRIAAIAAESERLHGDPYGMNRIARAHMRKRKRSAKEREVEASRMGFGSGVELSSETDRDFAAAARALGTERSRALATRKALSLERKARRLAIRSSSIFESRTGSDRSRSTGTNSVGREAAHRRRRSLRSRVKGLARGIDPSHFTLPESSAGGLSVKRTPAHIVPRRKRPRCEGAARESSE
jgi:hypothetical protein